MEVCLIVPPYDGKVSKTSKIHRAFPPYSLLIMATILKEDGHKVRLFDFNSNAQIDEKDFKESLLSSDVALVTTTPYFDWQCPSDNLDFALNWTSKLKNTNLIIMGNHGTHYPTYVLEKSKAKVVVQGEPEGIISNLVNSIFKDEELKLIEGLSLLMESGEVFHTPKRKSFALEDLPSADYSLIDLNDYYYELLGGQFAILEGARGCPFSCNFCNLSMFNKKYRKTDAQKLCNEIEDLVENHGCTSLYIFDLEYTINKKMVHFVSDFIIQKGYVQKFKFKWACQTRADSVDMEMLKAMKQSGCSLIHFGVEAGNEEVLKNTSKRITKDRIREGISLCRKVGIASACFFIFGHPNEKETEIQETIDFSLDLSPDYASFHKFLSFPGSPLFRETYGEEPYLDIGPSEHGAYKVRCFNLEESILDKLIKKAYLRFYLRPKFLLRYLNPKEWLLLSRKIKLFLEFI